MDQYELKRLYEQNISKDTILAAYREIIAEKGIDAPGEYGSREPALGGELAFIAAGKVHHEALAFLFEAGLDPAVTGRYAYTLLHAAAKREYDYYLPAEGDLAATVNLLLDKKVSVLRKDENRKLCCYHYAAEAANYVFVETLAQRGCKLNMTGRDGNTGLHIAAEYVRHAVHNLEFAEKGIVFQMANNGEALEHYKREQKEYAALLDDFFKTVTAFAAAGVAIDEKNDYGKTALDIAVQSNAKKIAAFLSGAIGADGGDEEAITAGGMSVHQAAEKNDAAAIRAIAKSGADLNACCDQEDSPYRGRTALGICCSFMAAEAAAALLECGADPACKDSGGHNALYWCFSTDAHVILHAGVFENRNIPRIIEAMINKGLSINEPIDEDSNTLLLFACKSWRGTGYNRYTLKGVIVEEALKLGADINAANRFGETPLMWASARDFDIMENYQLQFLENGAEVNARDIKGKTALHYAAAAESQMGARTCAAMLLEFGADLSIADNDGKTALDIATKGEFEGLVKLLLDKM